MMTKKEEEKILLDLKALLKNRLIEGFKNKKGKSVDSVEYIEISNLMIDEDNDDRNKIIVTNVEALARVWVLFSPDAKSNDDIQLRNQKHIEFIYDNEIDNFKIDEKTAIFFDNTVY